MMPTDHLFLTTGWTLLHFLWQGAMIWLLTACAMRAMRRNTPSARYGVCTLALSALALTPAITFARVAASLDASSTATAAAPIPSSAPAASAPVHALSMPLLLRALVVLWMIGAVLLLLRLLLGWIRIRVFVDRLPHRAPAPYVAMTRRLAERMRLPRVPAVIEAATISVPTTVGLLRPVILLPIGMMTGLSCAEVETIIAHELAHIRRRDHLVNLLQSVVEAVLFFHPAVWWVGKRLRAEREYCCDDLAVAITGDALTFARALAELEQRRAALPQLSLASTGGSLVQRIARLIVPDRPARPAVGGAIGVLSLIGLAAASTSALAVVEIAQRSDEDPKTTRIVKQADQTLTLIQERTSDDWLHVDARLAPQYLLTREITDANGQVIDTVRTISDGSDEQLSLELLTTLGQLEGELLSLQVLLEVPNLAIEVEEPVHAGVLMFDANAGGHRLPIYVPHDPDGANWPFSWFSLHEPGVDFRVLTDPRELPPATYIWRHLPADTSVDISVEAPQVEYIDAWNETQVEYIREWNVPSITVDPSDDGAAGVWINVRPQLQEYRLPAEGDPWTERAATLSGTLGTVIYINELNGWIDVQGVETAEPVLRGIPTLDQVFLREAAEADDPRAVPILGDLPLIGNLFRTHQTQTETVDVLLELTEEVTQEVEIETVRVKD